MKPVIMLPPGQISKNDIERLFDNGFIVVTVKNPESVRFVEPPPLGYSAQEKAAIALCRHILKAKNNYSTTRSELSNWLVEFFISGSSLDASQPEPVKQVKQIPPKPLTPIP